MDRWGALELYDAIAQLQRAGREEDAQRLIAEAKWQSELSGRGDHFSDGFSGSLDGEVLDAPWRGPYDMPGNFERGQRTANSMANDAALGAGLSYEYEYDPEKGVEVVYQPGVPLGGPGGARHNAAFTRSVTLSGPPDTAKMVLHPQSPGNWDPHWDWVGPEGPRSREGLSRGRVQGRGVERFRDFIWRSLGRRNGRGFRLSGHWLDAL